MGKKIRLDRCLANQGIGTRSEVRKIIFKKQVTVNDEIVKDIAYKVDPEVDIVIYNDTRLGFDEYIYIMLNKKAGTISATEDNFQKTVIDDIIHPQKDKLFPVGRLDKDTEGLLLLTNDGQLAHSLLSPKKHVSKCYEAKIVGHIDESAIKAFENGLQVEDGYTCMPAKLEIGLKDKDRTNTKVTIKEGKFHQIKKMFRSVGCEVVYLKRITMGSLQLDNSLALGEYRILNKEEIDGLRNNLTVT